MLVGGVDNVDLEDKGAVAAVAWALGWMWVAVFV